MNTRDGRKTRLRGDGAERDGGRPFRRIRRWQLMTRRGRSLLRQRKFDLTAPTLFILPVRAVCSVSTAITARGGLQLAHRIYAPPFVLRNGLTPDHHLAGVCRLGRRKYKQLESYDECRAGVDSGPIPSTTTTVCSLRMMTPPLTLTTAMQIAAAYGGASFEHRGPQCLLIVTRSTIAPPLEISSLCVCACPLCIINRVFSRHCGKRGKVIDFRGNQSLKAGLGRSDAHFQCVTSSRHQQRSRPLPPHRRHRAHHRSGGLPGIGDHLRWRIVHRCSCLHDYRWQSVR